MSLRVVTDRLRVPFELCPHVVERASTQLMRRLARLAAEFRLPSCRNYRIVATIGCHESPRRQWSTAQKNDTCDVSIVYCRTVLYSKTILPIK